MPSIYVKVFKYLILFYVAYRIIAKLYEHFKEPLLELREMVRELRGKK